MMPDFSAYDSYDTQSVSSVSSGTAQPLGSPAFYSHKSLKRKRSESTDGSDDGEERDYNYLHTSLPAFGRPYPVRESSYTLPKSDDRGHAAKRARLADDFAELKLRGQSLSPTSGTNPSPFPLWTPTPPPVIEEHSPPVQAPVEIDLTDEQSLYPPASIPLDVDVGIAPTGILRGEVEEVVSPGVQAERLKGKATTDDSEHDIKMHGTSSYEPEKDRIVITDLDDFSDSDGESSSTKLPSASTPYKISSAYLSQFGHIPRAEFNFEDLGDVDNNKQALVAYRPLVQTINTVPSRPNVFRGYIEEVEDCFASSPTNMQSADVDGIVVEPYPDDAMDIDME